MNKTQFSIWIVIGWNLIIVSMLFWIKLDIDNAKSQIISNVYAEKMCKVPVAVNFPLSNKT